MLGNFAAVSIYRYFTVVVFVHTLYIVSNRQHHLIADQTFIYQIQGDLIGHFPYHQTGFGYGIGTVQHLSGADTAGFRPISFDVGNGAGLHAPGVVDEQFCIDTKQLVKQFFIGQ